MMIRLCPNCTTERPVTEIFCEGVVNGQTCGWDLSAVDITAPGTTKLKPSPPLTSQSKDPTCRNGHQGSPGDLVCGVCGEPIVESAEQPSPAEPPPTPELPPETETVVDGWRLQDRIASSSAVRERFVATRASDGQRGILTLYAVGSEPDQAIYDLLVKLPRDHVPEFFATGRWQERAYEVAEEFKGGTLADFAVDPADPATIATLVGELGKAVHALTEAGLRHRDLRPSVVFVRSKEPLDLVIGGFGSARLSEFDLDIVSPLETTRYMAPEAIAGGVAPASDWWSMGMILLEKITQGACFEGINEQAFLIHVLTNGVQLPENLDERISTLLRGLLARDRRQRWQWKEVQAWPRGENVSAPAAEAAGEKEGQSSISLGGKQYRSANMFALAAAEAGNWDQAKALVLRGAVASWASEAGFEASVAAGLRQIVRTEHLQEDLKLSISLKTLNPSMPLIVRGNIVTPGWLLDHPSDGYTLITGPAPDLLRKIDADDWLWRLKVRSDAVRKRLAQLEIAVEEDALRVHLLSTSMARLAALWEERRKLLPDSDHAGVATLTERRISAEEDLIILLSATSNQFRSASEVIEEAEKEASTAGLGNFSAEEAMQLLGRPRREIYQAIDERIQNFARCGIQQVDEWADQFRLDRRMPLGRALALLCVELGAWRPLPKQGYVSTILDFFAKRISGGVLRGPLTRMLIGKSTRIDLTELDTSRVPAAEILDQLIGRTSRTVNLDPAAFADDDGLERRLRSLHSHALLYKRDTGIDGLFMGFPFLIMRDHRPNARPRIAPVLLWPIRINPEVGNRGHVTLSYGREKNPDTEIEHVLVNPALEAMLGIPEARRWQEAANELLTHASLSVQAAMDAFSRLAEPAGNELTALPGKDVQVGAQERQLVPAAVLFHLAFMGQAVMKDLETLRGLPPTATALEAALRLNEQQAASSAFPPVKEADRYFTADSDPSQEAAVLEARQAPGLVIEGPPGTGKSQTIVNMVADAIGTGKSLLVICQKQAALEVVRKRLEKERLTDRFVMITDANRDREPIVGAIRSQVEALHNRSAGGSPAWKRERDRIAARIETLEMELDRRQIALHSVDDRTGLSYRALLGELLEIEEGRTKPIDAPELRSLLADLHPADVATIEENCGPLARSWLASKFEDNPLSALKPFSADRGTSTALASHLQAFLQADARREQTDAETSNCLKISDAVEFRSWLAEADELRSISASVCANLARLRPLFRSVEDGTSEARRILEGLSAIKEIFSSLDGPSYKPNFCSKLIAFDEEELCSAGELAGQVRLPAGAVQWINPLHWLRTRRVRQLLASLQLPQDNDAISSLYYAVELELAIRQPRRELEQYFTILFGRAPNLDLSPGKLADFAERLGSFLNGLGGHNSLIERCPSRLELDRALSAGTTEELGTFFERADLALTRHDTREDSRAALERLNTYFDELWLGSRRSAIENGRSNASAIDQIVQALPMLNNYQEYRLRSSRLDAKERAIFATLRSRESELAEVASEDLDACIRATIGREARLAWKADMEGANPDVLFDADELDAKVKSLAEADAQIRQYNRDLLVQGIDAAKVRPTGEWDAITRLRGPRALRLREFIDRAAPLGLFALRPVWLMTPDVASRVLQPRAGLFDTVIFDEASQMPVEYALPSLFRSRLVVVSGDEKQMPPTSFFASRVENDEAAIFDGEEPEEGASEEEREAFAETWNRREIKDCPDLLQLARSVLRTRTLQVHYRSKYRELISFSNASFYGNTLSVPVRHPQEIIRRLKPIEVVRTDGTYKAQTNQKEASDVVQYLAKLWEDSSPPSVGVVTFNRKQADAIEDALEERAEDDAAFREALMRERERVEHGEDMGFFVKNVENVQGDERDIIVFSTTFGRNEHGVFRKTFGALGHAGGERRLNVAVTRAREKVVIATSMPISEISDLLTRRSGPRVPRDYLQGYLEYARTISDGLTDSGKTLLDRMVSEQRPHNDSGSYEDDGFTRSVEAFLEANGYKPSRARDGGAFSLDFAVTDPRTGLYAIGVECDAPRHRLLEKARAREIWRPNVLGRAVPYVHRVSSYAWAHAPDAERLRLKKAVEHALGGGALQ
ncbi:histidine kinase [Bradyrhizobium sp. UFLA03-84]|uniref:AAA domain-containing protein n=1 Tax=Bradyrhizobium sp. UFLA03-84 TaxID=418599 RepID=UPI000BAE23DA|nr:AAA domain-containing protein [Bradyrhizobium sp. UFLA03-84]PAY08525.1 histidine kinase [Bradyrhizobium sp. UFLA03-84]